MIGLRTISSELREDWDAYRARKAHADELDALIDRRDDLSDLDDGNRIAFWTGIALTAFSVGMTVVTWTGDLAAFIGVPVTALSILAAMRQFFADRRQKRLLRRKTRDRLNSIKIIDYATFSLVELTDRIALPASYKNSGYKVEYLHHGFGAWSPQVSDWLISGAANTASFDHDVSRYDGPVSVRNTIAPYIEFSRTASQKHFSNDAKIRMLTDLVVDAKGNFPDIVHLQRTNYLATLATNDLSFKEVINRQTREVHYDGLSGFLAAVDEQLVYRGLAGSACANQIGVSTLAFTADHYLVLVDQSQENLQSAGLVAPSGSGSLDEKDLDAVGGKGALMEWLTRASKRELLEELGLAESSEFGPEANAAISSVEVEVHPIGFCNYLFRGGKPEFFFLARLSCTIDTLNSMGQYTKAEEQLSSRFPKQEDYRLRPGVATASAELARICDAVRKAETYRMSFPLELQLKLVEYACGEHSKIVNGFFSDEPARI